MGIILVLFYFLFPAFLLYLSTKYPVINKIGVVVFCYVGGLILGNVDIIPESIYGLQDTLRSATIVLGIPMILFSENVVKWARMAKNTFVSLLLGIVSVFIMVLAGYFIFREKIPEIWQISGMLIGLYTGGTPNLAAISEGLNVEIGLFTLTNTVDIAIGGIILVFMITVAKSFFSLFMKPYKPGNKVLIENKEMDAGEFESFSGFFSRAHLPGLMKAMVIAVIILGLAMVTMSFFQGDTKTIAAILTVTTLGILASLIPYVNRIEKSFQLGLYFIYVFCIIAATLTDIRALFQPDSIERLLNITYYILLSVPGALLVHSLLSWIFRVSVDDFMITSTALSMSPPMVPVVAAALSTSKGSIFSCMIPRDITSSMLPDGEDPGL